MTRVRIWKLVVGILACMALASCGGDDGGDQPPGGDGSETPAPADAGTDADPDAGAGAGDAETPDDANLGAIATGLRVALQAERVEVDGNTIHIYVKESDGIVAGAGSECLVAAGVVPDDTTVVIHRDGDETTC